MGHFFLFIIMHMHKYTHLHCHSEYSIKNSLIRIDSLINKTKSLGMDSIAITDENNLFAAIKFYKKAIQANIKPIFGSEIVVKNNEFYFKVLLLCQNHQGYLNLCQLISNQYLNRDNNNNVFISIEDLKKFSQGLILINCAVDGDINQYLLKNNFEKAKQTTLFWNECFNDRFYLAVQRTKKPNDEKLLRLTLELAHITNIPVVATNCVLFLEKENFNAHEVRVCITQGGYLDDVNRKKKYSEEQYLKSTEEMNELFSDIPKVLINSYEIAKRCNLSFSLKSKNFLPNFPIPKGENLVDYFNKEAFLGLEKISKSKDINYAVYKERLKYEITIINEMGFSGYFLIVSDFIRWAKSKSIPVGPGRGSGAGSLAAYCLDITSVDPIEHELLFERFLNPGRTSSMPDFDIDFCTVRREEVIDYVSNKYGSEKVSQIITYGTMLAKGVIRDVGRVMGHAYGFSDELARLIPNELKMTLDKALEDSKELKEKYDSNESVKDLIDTAKELENLVRNVGTHAGGIVIAPNKISDFCPIYKGDSEDDSIVSQFDKDDIEDIGLVKFDFLGLSNLTVINQTLEIIEANFNTKIDIDNLALDDKKTYDLLQKCLTVGVFQLESEGIRSYLKKLKPDCFDDIVAILALYRPGPLSFDKGRMVDDYINVKHGAKAKYPHQKLEKILKPTNGIFLYQEQVMQSAQILANYSLVSADTLRRAMGKKKPEEMAEQRSVFIEGCEKNKIPHKKANEIFNLIDTFSGYGFNKSHSVAYAIISYQTAYLKANYPAAFMAAVLSNAMGDTDRIAFTIKESKNMGINILSPSINSSNYMFSVINDKNINYGLGAIKGVGEGLIKEIERVRKNKKFKDLFDFCLRIEKIFLNKRAIESLIFSGAFDEFGIHRKSLIKTLDSAIKQAEQYQHSKKIGQNFLFNNAESPNDKVHYKCIPWGRDQELEMEKNVLGFYFSAHPTNFYENDLKLINAKFIHQIVMRNNRNASVAGLITNINFKHTKNGKMAAVTIEDGKKDIVAVFFSKNLTISNEENLILNKVVIVNGRIKKDFKNKWQIVAKDIDLISNVKIRYAKYLKIILTKIEEDKFNKLARLLHDNKGKCPVAIVYKNDESQGALKLNSNWNVYPTNELKHKVNKLLGNNKANIIYN